MSDLHDVAAESTLVATLLALPTHVPEAALVVEQGDFFSERNAGIFAALCALHAAGHPIDGYTVLDECRRTNVPVEASDLADLMRRATGSWRRHAERVVDLAVRRRIVHAGQNLATAAADLLQAPDDVLETHNGFLATVSTARREPPTDLTTVAEVARRQVTSAPWIIPGIIRKGWRIVLVAPEGRGKTLIMRQAAIAVSQGIHPFTYERCQPKVTLLVDLENPEDNVVEWSAKLVDVAGRTAGEFDESAALLWHRPGGLDLRSRGPRSELDAICARYKPDLVCLGPLYKAYLKHPGERGHEDAVRHLQSILDDLRTRHGFGLLLEHHAPLDASNGSNARREMRPADTALWLRWPELGIGLYPNPDLPGALDVKRNRGDRVRADWPDRLERGQSWPWMGQWKRDGAATQNRRTA